MSTAAELRRRHRERQRRRRRSSKDSRKLVVVLDIDETLVHSVIDPAQDRFRQAEDGRAAQRGPYPVDQQAVVTMANGFQFKLNKRPGLDAFLKRASQKYDLYAYTAAVEEYARPVIDQLDPNDEYFIDRFFRCDCLHAQGHFLKDLRHLRSTYDYDSECLDRMVLVDNNPYCFLPQLANGVPISSFFDDPQDTALRVLETFLDALAGEPTVYPTLEAHFGLTTLLKPDQKAVLGAGWDGYAADAASDDADVWHGSLSSVSTTGSSAVNKKHGYEEYASAPGAAAAVADVARATTTAMEDEFLWSP